MNVIDTEASSKTTVLAAIFEPQADIRNVVQKLRVAGFQSDELSVLTSDEQIQKDIEPYLDESIVSVDDDQRLNTAGKVGLGLGGAAIATTLMTSAGTSLFVIGAFSGLAILGTFVSLMMSRGLEKESVDFYEQELMAGRTLVTVELDEESTIDRSQKAIEILSAAGGRAFELPSG